MKLVVDTSVLYTLFNERSKARDVALKVELIAPEFSISEVQEHKEDIKLSFKLEDWQYEFILRFWIHKFVKFVPLKEYVKYLKQAMHFSVDPDDIDFFALSLAKNRIPIWSNEKELRGQDKVKVLSNKELLKKFRLI